MATAATKKLADVIAAAIEGAVQNKIEPPTRESGRLAKLNTDGKMLKYLFTLQKRPGAPDPLCITINEEFYWVKRGKPVEVPWYLVEHMKLNIERKYRQEKDEHGKNIVVGEDMPSESFTATPINPAPDTVL